MISWIWQPYVTGSNLRLSSHLFFFRPSHIASPIATRRGTSQLSPASSHQPALCKVPLPGLRHQRERAQASRTTPLFVMGETDWRTRPQIPPPNGTDSRQNVPFQRQREDSRALEPSTSTSTSTSTVQTGKHCEHRGRGAQVEVACALPCGYVHMICCRVPTRRIFLYSRIVEYARRGTS